MGTEVLTLVLSSIGAASGVISLAWNIISSRRAGPLIDIEAACSGSGADMKVTGSVLNQGRFDAHLKSVLFGWVPGLQGASLQTGGLTWGYSSAIWVEIPPANIANLAIPGLLTAENGQEFVITGLDRIHIGLEVALHEHRRIVMAIRTASGKQTSAVIKYA
jgi:hypothetical protein